MHAGLEIDRYRVEAFVGSGGMAQVWSARHMVLGSRRALKVLMANGANLVHEGQLQARIEHPNILPVLDVLEHDGGHILVMPLIEGPTLRDVVAHHQLALGEAVQVFLDVLSGVQAAHDMQIVHRDLKPANVLLQVRGSVVVPKVADFGISSTIGTRAPVGLGTRAYAPPKGQGGAETDYWSLGVLLHELVTGHRPEGDTLDVPDRLAPLLRALLEPDPLKRLCDASAVRSALADLPRTALLASRLRMASERADDVPGTAFTAPPVRSSTARPAMHTDRDSFVGRVSEATTLTELLQSPGLVSVVGPGGVGKTRLALHTARKLAFPGGIYIANFTEARTPSDMVREVSTALALPQTSSSTLTSALSGRGRILVLLDNVEQVAQFAEETVGSWLASAPQATFLATTRQGLRLRGERVLSLDVLEPDQAVTLYLDRARAVGATTFDNDALHELVSHLDHLPLAIELAAARARTIGAKQLIRRIAGDDNTQRFRLLVSRDRDASPRQRTLEATLAWSWQLLSTEEQSTLAQLSVFEGGFSLEDAEAVVDNAWVDDVLTALVEKSLVRTYPVNAPDGTHELRMGLLVSIQAFAAKQLDKQADTLDARTRHLHWFTQAATEDGFHTHGATELRHRTLIDADNHRACLVHALATDELVLGSEAALMVWMITEPQGPHSPMIEPLKRLIRLAESDVGNVRHATEDERRRADLLCRQLLARVYLKLRRVTEAEALLHDVVEKAALYGAMRHHMLALHCLGAHLADSSTPAAARVFLDQALDLSRSLGERMWEGQIISALARMAEGTHSSDVQSDLIRQALIIHQEVGNQRSEGYAWNNLGAASSRTDNHRETERLYRKGLAVFERVGHRRGRATVLQNLADLAFTKGALDLAASQLSEAIRLFRLTGDRKTEGRRQKLVAQIRERQGRIDDAHDALDAGERALRATQDNLGLGLIFLGRASLLLHTDQPLKAESALLEASRLIGQRRGTAGEELDAVRAAVRERRERQPSEKLA